MPSKLLVVLFFVVSIIWAKSSDYTLTQRTYEAITKAQTLMQKGKNDEAITRLMALKNSSKVDSRLDKAYIEFFMGYLYRASEHTIEAQNAFKQALAYNALSKKLQQESYENLIELALLQQHYHDVITYINRVDTIEKAESIDRLQRKYYAYYMLKSYNHAMVVLKKLLTDNPNNKTYWLELSSLYYMQEDFSSALASLDIAHILELPLDASEAIRLSEWLYYAKLPYQAAQILEHFMQQGVVIKDTSKLARLADFYVDAKEIDLAIETCKVALTLEKSQKLYYMLGRLYHDKRAYKKAIEALNMALKSKEDRGVKYILLGKCYYEVGDIAASKRAFKAALVYERSKGAAMAWLEYISHI